MPTYKAIDILCEHCNYVWDELVTKEQEEEDCYDCPNCDRSAGHRTVSRINPTRSSYVDGTQRPGFDGLKKAAKLEIEMMNKKPEDRAEIKKEIRKLKEIKK